MKSQSLLVLVFLLSFVSCGREQEPENVAESFLSDYLECRFKSAARWAEPEVVEVMRWRASNLTQAEVELLGEQSCEVASESVEEYGDSAVVTLVAHDALLLDSIGRPGHVGDARYRLTLKKEKGSNWKVTVLVGGINSGI